MNHFLVNGVERPSPVEQSGTFEGLLTFIHRNMSHESSLVSAIRVNGVEINAKDEEILSKIPLQDIDRVEVILMHPREMAEDTLQTMLLFTERLADMSRASAESFGQADADTHFNRLIDGLETFMDSLRTVKVVLHIGQFKPVDVLEADMTSIMRDLLQAKETNNVDYAIQLLQDHLPNNLHDWCVTGIPSMIKSRDS